MLQWLHNSPFRVLIEDNTVIFLYIIYVIIKIDVIWWAFIMHVTQKIRVSDLSWAPDAKTLKTIIVSSCDGWETTGNSLITLLKLWRQMSWWRSFKNHLQAHVWRRRVIMRSSWCSADRGLGFYHIVESINDVVSLQMVGEVRLTKAPFRVTFGAPTASFMQSGKLGAPLCSNFHPQHFELMF